MTDYAALIVAGGLDGHGIYYFVPSLVKHFSTARINVLIAPRPHLRLAGNLACPGATAAELSSSVARMDEAWQSVATLAGS